MLRPRALNLYAQILRLHRRKLPHDMRQLGDAYVREEFKRHKKAEAKFLTSFFAEWENYVDTLEQQDTLEKVGKNLDSGTVETMSTEQKQQLAKLLMEVEQGSSKAATPGP